jgi:flagellar assembly protein FliH
MLCKLIRPQAGEPVNSPAWQPRATHGPPARPPQPPNTPGTPQVDPAAAEVDARLKAAHQQGYAAGEAAEAGRAAQRAAQKMEPAVASLAAVVKELTGMRKRVRMEAEESAVKLAIAIGRRIIHRELATDPEAILGLVVSAFQKLNAREVHRLRVAPADLAVIQEIRARLNLPPGLEISADSELPPGSAIFETSRGELDASVDTQLAEIDRGFADIVKRRSK